MISAADFWVGGAFFAAGLARFYQSMERNPMNFRLCMKKRCGGYTSGAQESTRSVRS